MKDLKNVYFVSGIDTDAGKSYCTAWWAQQLQQEGKRVITMKFIQTGNRDISEDIELHRRLMGTGLLPDDLAGLTMPVIFTYPCSPHLAARIDRREIDFERIEACIRELSARYDVVLVEGAGGLMVPLSDIGAPSCLYPLTIDFVALNHLPLVFVTGGRLGSINHTLLSFEAIRSRGIRLDTVLYNHYPESKDTTIMEDTRHYISTYVEKVFPEAGFRDVPVMKG